MIGLNGFALALFCILQALSARLCRCGESTRRKTLRVLCGLLLIFNVLRYTLTPLLGGPFKLPVEFSAFAYFVVPIIILAGWQRLRSWAAYSAVMAGFFYYMALIALGGPLYGDWPVYDVYSAMYCHGTLYLCGTVIIGTGRCPEKDRKQLIGGVAYVGLRAVLLRPLIKGSEELLIYMQLDGALVRQLLPSSLWPVALPLYYVLLGTFVLVSIRLFFTRSEKAYQKYSLRRGLLPSHLA